MNYRHAFHAGNFADVHKHIVLMLLLEHLRTKPTPFFVLDTHAGRGRYELDSSDATRGAEWSSGIGRMRTANVRSKVIAAYAELVNANSHVYLGSPLIATHMLRSQDRAVFVEKNASEVAVLRQAMGRRERVSVLMDDGYRSMTAYLPPKENRGLVLIDPPFESANEIDDALAAIVQAYRRWPNGMYCLWHPIKANKDHERLYKTFAQKGIKKILLTTLNIRPGDSPLGLNGSGLLLINPPWKLDEQLRELAPMLHEAMTETLAPFPQNYRVEWLTAEA